MSTEPASYWAKPTGWGPVSCLALLPPTVLTEPSVCRRVWAPLGYKVCLSHSFLYFHKHSAPATLGCWEVLGKLHVDLSFASAPGDCCEPLAVPEGGSRAQFKQAESFSLASKVSSPTSAVPRKVPQPSQADSGQKGQETGRPDLSPPHYLVALGTVLYPELRHARVCACGQGRV